MLISEVSHKKNYSPAGLARRATGDLNTLARRIIPLAPGYRTALLSRPEKIIIINNNKTIKSP